MISAASRVAGLLIDPPVDPGDLFHPAAAVGVLKCQDITQRPVQVVRKIGYLLVELIEGVAFDSPNSPKLTSTPW